MTPDNQIERGKPPTKRRRRRRRSLDPRAILTPAEVTRVLAYLDARSQRSPHTWQKAVIFRLTVIAGLRASEIALLELRDMHLDQEDAYIELRPEAAKYGSARDIPVITVSYTAVENWRKWLTFRREMGAGPRDPVCCTLTRLSRCVRGHATEIGQPLSRFQVWQKWKSAVRILGPARVSKLHTHSGRHTCATQLLRSGRPLTFVRDFLGHTSIGVTSLYLHVCPEDLSRRGELYSPTPSDGAARAT